MSVRVLSWALRDAPVTKHADLLVLIAIADHAHDDGSGAYPSVATLAAMARVSPRTVRDAVRRLETSGIVETEHQPGRNNVYRVLMTPANAAGVPRQMATGTPADGDRDPGRSRQEPRQQLLPPIHKNRQEPSGEPGVPPSKSSKVIQHPSARRKPEPYYDRALR